MYELFIANKNYSSWSLRPWVLMSQLGIPFTEQLVPFGAGDNFETFRKFSPSGKVPCLRTDDTVVWDSLAIAEFLAEAYPQVWPSDAIARAWARSAAAEMHSSFSALRQECSMTCGLRIRLNTVSLALQTDLTRLEELWNEGLQRFGGPFLAGSNFTAVDAFFCPVAFRIQTYDLPLSSAARAYCARLLALPAMQRWYNEALAETWREAKHETYVLQFGTVFSDLRQA